MTEEFVTGIFTTGYDSFMGVVGWLALVVIVFFVVNVIAVGGHDPSELPPTRDRIGIVSILIWFPALILAIALTVVDITNFYNTQGDREVLMTNELIDAGYSSAFEVELDDPDTADDGTFKYVKDDAIISCEFVGTSDAIKYLVVCHE